MNPLELSNLLRRIATKLDVSKNPSRHLVVRDLISITASLEPSVKSTHKAVFTNDLDMDKILGDNPKFTNKTNVEIVEYLEEDPRHAVVLAGVSGEPTDVAQIWRGAGGDLNNFYYSQGDMSEMNPHDSLGGDLTAQGALDELIDSTGGFI